MPTLRVELPARLSQAEIEALRGDLAPYGYVDELPSASPQGFALSAREVQPHAM
jgi:hypothetical protein